jgi:hypothetical protein
VNINEKIKSLSTIFDDVEQMDIGPNLSEEDYKNLMKSIVDLIARAYDRGFSDGQSEGKRR